MNRIEETLHNLFDRHRLVFWYDDGGELRSEFESVELPGVTPLEVNNTEFGVKVRVARDEPKQKFLLYFPHARPENPDNWLLDLLLANTEFQADTVSLVLADLGLPFEFRELVQAHGGFFNARDRVDRLRKLLETSDSKGAIRLKMIAVVCRCEPRVESVLIALLSDFAREELGKLEELERYGLAGCLWEQVERVYGYESEMPGIQDFLFSLFKANYDSRLGSGTPCLNRESLVLLSRWQDSATAREGFEKLSGYVADRLGVEEDLQGRSWEDLIENDLFALVDRRILVDLRDGLLKESLSPDAVIKACGDRKSTHWYESNRHLYQAVEAAARFVGRLAFLDIDVRTLDDGIRKYAQTYSAMDRLYRAFIFHWRQSNQSTFLDPLHSRIENLYSNQFLLPLNDGWQQRVVDECEAWTAETVPRQDAFFEKFVQPYLRDGKKLFVVISDALRYEAGAELHERVTSEDRFASKLDVMLGCLPSYTQLGMAALLPHEELSFSEDCKGVLADGNPTSGLANRRKVLQARIPRATAIRAEDFLAMPAKTEGRELARDHDLIYIYHNGIDKTGDSRESEEKTFEAVEQELEALLNLLKKIAAVNGNNILVTADHGFLYQNSAIDDSDFAMYELPDGMLAGNRRFVLGDGLAPQPSLRKFTAGQLGLAGETDVLIPKSINRMRVQGAGSRYVHGGASLQEVVLPVVAVRKKRTSDVECVDVDVLQSSNRITSRQVVVSFVQTDPAGGKMLPRDIRAGFYDREGTLLTELKELCFDSTAEDARERERKVTFNFSTQAGQGGQGTITLRLEIPAAKGTSHWRTYRDYAYQLKLSFASEFDDF